MARPTKLTGDVQERICNALRAGNYQETAAQYAGISAKTFYEWMKRGESDDESEQIYREFREAVESAKASAEVRDVALIDRAAHDGSWQAAAWKLERKYPHRWGRVHRTEISGPEGKPLHVEVDAKTALLRKLGLVDADPDV